MKHETNNKLKKIITSLLLLILFFVSLLYVFKTLAQNIFSSQTLEVSPPSQELSIDPGKTIVAKAKVRNRSRETVSIKVRIEDFTASGEEGQIALVDAGTYSLTKWAKLSPEQFNLKPGEQQEVEATVSVPPTGAGGRYGSFVFGVVPPGAKGGEATVSQEIASLFLLRISGPVTENLSLTQVKAPRFSEFGPVPIDLKFYNSGNVHVKTFGLVNVSDMFGKKVADVVVTGTNVFPGASRIVRSTLDKKLLVGNFNATAIMYYGTVKNQTLTGSTSFFVFPVRLVAAIIIVLLILYSVRKRLKKALKDLLG